MGREGHDEEMKKLGILPRNFLESCWWFVLDILTLFWGIKFLLFSFVFCLLFFVGSFSIVGKQFFLWVVGLATGIIFLITLTQWYLMKKKHDGSHLIVVTGPIMIFMTLFFVARCFF